MTISRLYKTTLMFYFCLVATLLAQEYNYDEIKENLFRERPQVGDPLIRQANLFSIDDHIYGYGDKPHPDTEWFYTYMIDKAIFEIRSEKVESGASIWQIYNHGFVIKTATVTIGIDLFDFYRIESFLELADLIDVYLISHDHSDHHSIELMNRMKSLGKPVIVPAERFRNMGVTGMQAGDTLSISGTDIIAHDGLHIAPLRIYEVITPEGYKFLHTGDNEHSEILPDVEDVDVMMLNVYVNESGSTSHIVGMYNAISKIRPVVTLPAHINELEHWGKVMYSYQDASNANVDSLPSAYHILAWGERYHYSDTMIDSIRPNEIEDITHETGSDSIVFTWDTPPLAADGDSAFCYRIIDDSQTDIFTFDSYFEFVWDSIKVYEFSFFTYDKNWNQSEQGERIRVPVPGANTAPVLSQYYPLNMDTVYCYPGVYKYFNIDAQDPDGDTLQYRWYLNDFLYDESDSSSCIFSSFNIDSGHHEIKVTASDGFEGVQKSWPVIYDPHHAIVDNEDTLMYTEFGNWETQENAGYGGSSRRTHRENLNDWAAFQYDPQESGLYEVSTFIPETQLVLDQVLYTIESDGELLDTVIINQAENGGNWERIGKYYFPVDNNIRVKITNPGAVSRGTYLYADAIKFVPTDDMTNIKSDQSSVQTHFTLLECYPNPFNPSTEIRYTLSEAGNVSLKIYNLLGRLIDTLVEEEHESGIYSVKWHADHLHSGIYFCRLYTSTQNKVTTKKMLLLK